MNIEIPAM